MPPTAIASVEQIDLLDRDAFALGVPHSWFTYLRANHPVYHHPEPDGPGFWVFSRYADVVAIGRDGVTFSSDQSKGGVIGLEEPVVAPADFGDAKIMLMMDPPQHTRYRKLVNRGFTPRMINALEQHIRDMTVKLLDEAVAKGEVDFVVDVAAELPLMVIAELIGVPMEDRHKLFDWSNRMVGSEDPEYAVSEDQAASAQMEMFAYANQLAEARRSAPKDDIISVLLASEIDGDALTELEFNLFFMLLAVAGNETTRNAIAHGMNAFLENPDQYRRLVEQPTELINSATEEILRWASPVMYFKRYVTKPTKVGGQALSPGEKVSMWYVSANRDEDVFSDPFAFDISRDPNPHIAFGGGGPHHCLGSNLARMEIRVLFEELARRVPELEALEAPQPLRSNFIGGIKHLPVRLKTA
ncbi:MAG TPA: cytochrome P450 [Acidimicrobiales bacterium]|nr:cytochrome P450 [Acidimicrobiales bacterium]